MTETPLLQTYPVPRLSPRTPCTPVPNGRPMRNDVSTDNDPVSDTIRCVCGFEADDGSSVLCELCRTWQHVFCYYEDEGKIPGVHECANCRPRELDQARIKERQQAFTNLTYMIEWKPKRASAKSHKKKPKDVPAAVALANGHADDATQAHDGNIVGPKDHQPPHKKQKINCSRKRAASTAQTVHSPNKSPGPAIPLDYAPDHFSNEFLNLYVKSGYTQITANSFCSLELTNTLQKWLFDPEATKQASGGKTRDQIFQRPQGTMKDLEENAPILKENTHIGTNATKTGLHPIFKWVTVESDVPYGGFVAELRGQIGRKEEYCSNTNRWQSLRHPEPFVFFVPSLPLYVDTRHEGNLIRYIRRSCRPNVYMKILITGEFDYHFCFIAREPIRAGCEISIGWDIDKDIKNALEASLQNGNIHERGIQEVEGVSQWVAGVLSDFGGCACNLPIRECPLALADRRNTVTLCAHPPKPKKSRRTGPSHSPPSHDRATNSREGSEVQRTRDEYEDENVDDNRSVSGSSRSKQTSRDITPMTHISNDNAVVLGVEMSDREKRKLMQQEKLFEQLEHDEQHAQRKRKRNSAASTANTPGVASSKQMAHSESSLGGTAVASKSRATDTHSRCQNTSGRHASHRHARVSKGERSSTKAEYADSSTQTEHDVEFPSSLPSVAFRRKPKASFLRSLLQRTQDPPLHWRRLESTPHSPPFSELRSNTVKVEASLSSTALPAAPPTSAEPVTHTGKDDVEMRDAIAVPPAHTPALENEQVVPVATASDNADQSERSPPRSPQPLPSQKGSPNNTAASSRARLIRDQMPLSPSARVQTSSATTSPRRVEAGVPALSVVTKGPALITPSARKSPPSSADAAPSSAHCTPTTVQRKAKMSLSDWTAKRKAKLEAKGHEAGKGGEEDKDVAAQRTTVKAADERLVSSVEQQEKAETNVGEGA